MEKRELKVGDVLQIKPDAEKFGGFLVIVTEPKPWGCQGYLLSPDGFDAVRYKGVAYVRPLFENVEFVGKLHWIREESKENGSGTSI